MNNPTEPTLKDATEPASTFSEGNSEGDYALEKKDYKMQDLRETLVFNDYEPNEGDVTGSCVRETSGRCGRFTATLRLS